MIKRLICMVMVICLVAASSVAFAAYSWTQEFLTYLEEKGVKYSYQGTNDDGDEIVKVSYTGDYCPDIVMKFFFDQNGKSVSIKVWNLIDYDLSSQLAVLQTCDSLNYKYRWVRFYTDPSDNSVTADVDCIINPNTGTNGYNIYEVMRRLLVIVDEGYQQLMVYKK